MRYDIRSTGIQRHGSNESFSLPNGLKLSGFDICIAPDADRFLAVGPHGAEPINFHGVIIKKFNPESIIASGWDAIAQQYWLLTSDLTLYDDVGKKCSVIGSNEIWWRATIAASLSNKLLIFIHPYLQMTSLKMQKVD